MWRAKNQIRLVLPKSNCFALAMTREQSVNLQSAKIADDVYIFKTS